MVLLVSGSVQPINKDDIALTVQVSRIKYQIERLVGLETPTTGALELNDRFQHTQR